MPTMLSCSFGKDSLSALVEYLTGLLSPAYRDGITRLGCWFCNLQRVSEFRNLRANYPDYWNILLALERDSPFPFTTRTGVRDLDRRFAGEVEISVAD